MRFSIITLLYFFLLPITKSYGQHPYNFKFKTYTYNDGLVHNYTKKCLKDSKGFLWIITQNGLSRFDGINFKNFQHNPSDSTSLPVNDLEDIAIDANNNIWLSYRTGLCFYNQANHRFTIIQHNKKPLPSSSIIFDKKRNCVWSVNPQGYAKIDTRTLALSINNFKEPELRNPHIYPIFIDSKDRLWIPYIRRSYHCIDLTKNTEFFYKKEEPEPTSIYEDEEHNIWMTTWQQGFRKIIVTDTSHDHILYEDPFLKIGQSKFDYISQAVTQSKALTGDNILWVAKNTDGILLFDKKRNKFVQQIIHDAAGKHGLPSNFISNIYTDPSGIVWISSWHGLSKVNKQEQQFVSREIPWLNAQLYNCVSGIVDDPYQKNITWIAAAGSGLFKTDKNTGEVLNSYFYYYHNKGFKGPDENYAWRWLSNFIKDTENNIWGITYGGAVKVENGKVLKIPLHKKDGEPIYPLSIKQTEKGFIWVAFDNGIAKINTTNNSYIFYEDESAKGFVGILGDLEELDGDHLIIGSLKGIKLFNRKTEKFYRMELPFLTADTVSELKVMDIEKIDNKLYLGSFVGLKVYNLDSKEHYFIGKEHGINKIDINRLQQDQNKNLWIFTSTGLFKYNTRKKTFEKFTNSDGIYDLSEDAIGFFPYNNRFYIGYRMAITHFDPLQVNINTAKVNPIITEVQINGSLLTQEISNFQQQSLQLSHRQNEIIFNYTAPDFTNADKITFRYQLEGYSTDWIEAGTRRTVSYNNLRPGKYSFKLMAANSTGAWNETITQFNFTIAAAFWQTLWFKALLIFALASIGYFIYRYRLKQLKKIYEVRSSISRSLHDEVGATLSSINIYSEVARNKTNEPAVKQLVDKVYDASANAMESMSDIVWYVNPKNDLLENLIVRMREYALPLMEAKGINGIFEVNDDIESMKTSMQQRHNVYLIYKEVVNNALKYAKAQNISITLTKEGNKVKMEIKDDGKGFDTNNDYTGNGLKNMQYRAKAISGELYIFSIPGNGTRVSLHFPIA